MKAVLKAVANGLALAAVLPCVLGFRLSSFLLGPARAFPGWKARRRAPARSPTHVG